MKEQNKGHPMDYMTIRECHQKMRSLGAMFSESYIRSLVAKGIIPYLQVGNRRMISFETAAGIISNMATGGLN